MKKIAFVTALCLALLLPFLLLVFEQRTEINRRFTHLWWEENLSSLKENVVRCPQTSAWPFVKEWFGGRVLVTCPHAFFTKDITYITTCKQENGSFSSPTLVRQYKNYMTGDLEALLTCPEGQLVGGY